MKIEKVRTPTEKKPAYSFSPLPLARDNSNVVVFRLDDQEYGLWLENVVETFRMVAITPVPEYKDLVEGIINLRGMIIPVLDLRKSLGFRSKPHRLSMHIIIARTNGHTIGLIVDGVTRVIDMSHKEIKLSKDISPHTKHLLGVAKTEDNLLLLLDIVSIAKQVKRDLLSKI